MKLMSLASKPEKTLRSPTPMHGPPVVRPYRRAKMTETMRVGPVRRMPGRARRGFGRIAGPFVILLALLAVDWGGFGSLALFGVRPHLLLVLACVTALHGGAGAGALIGAGIGLLSDLGGGHLMGLSVFGYAAAAAVAGSFSARLYSDRFVIVMAAVALGTVTEQLVYVGGAYAFGHPLSLAPLLTRLLPVLVLYHWILTPLLYPIGRRLVHSVMADSTESS